MDVSYKRSRGISCLVLLEDSQTAGQSYQKTIFLENSIPGLIPCKVQRLNGEEHFSYDITGCQSLENLFMKEKFSHKDLEKLLENWLRVCDALDEYLLDMDYLLLAPSYIYRNMHTGDYQFIWFPFQVAREKYGFALLAEYLLPKINHSDKSAVSLGYGVYKEAAEDNIYPRTIKELLYDSSPSNPEKESPEPQIPSAETEADEETQRIRKKLLDDFYNEEEEESASHRIFAAVCGILFLCILIFFLWHFRLLPLFWIIILLLILSASIGLGILIYFLLLRKKGTPEPLSKTPLKIKSLQKSSEHSIEKEIEEFPTSAFPPLKAEKGRNLEQPEKTVWESPTVLLENQVSLCPSLVGTGKNAGKTFMLKKNSLLVGKWSDSADIFLDEATVSRIHAKILREGMNCYVVDLNSKNGTRINGVSLAPEERKLLKNSDIIAFAKEEFRYTTPGFPLSPEPAEN